MGHYTSQQPGAVVTGQFERSSSGEQRGGSGIDRGDARRRAAEQGLRVGAAQPARRLKVEG